MENADCLQAVNAYWSREGLGQTILDSLVATGENSDALIIENLAPVDQFHAGGKGATKGLAELVDISRNATVLDVVCGLGGPARTLAALFGCKVTVRVRAVYERV